MGQVILNIEKVRNEIARDFREFSTPTICEAMGVRACMTSEVKPLYKNVRMAGIAVTCRCHVGDNLMLHKALQLAGPGDVIVVDHGAYTEAAPWGEMMSRVAKRKGLEGIVIDGMARDSVGISKIKFPVFARGTAIWGTLKKSAGSVNIPIECGGVHVVPGDLIVGDDDGVVVVPKNMARDVLEKAKARDEREKMLVRRIDAGVITDFMLDYRDEYDSLVESGEIIEVNTV